MLQRMCYWGLWLNVLLAFFNLIPIPPLDGSHIFYHLLPQGVRAKYREFSRYGFLVLLGLMLFFKDAFFLLLLPAIVLTRAAVSMVDPFALQPPPF